MASLTCGVGFFCHPRLHHWLLSRECTGRGSVEEHFAGSVFSVLCCTAGLLWAKTQETMQKLVTVETFAEELEQYTTGVKERLDYSGGLRQPARENKHRLRSAVQ